MKKLAIGLFAAQMSFAATTTELWPGNTWYVDDDNYGKSGLDGTTPATAFGSLQEANDASSVVAGDIIKVLPGVYNQGSSTHTEMNAARATRVIITKKLRFEAEKGTVQVIGELSTEANHYGADGMRCLYVASTAAGAEFHGMTFCNGSTSAGNGGSGGMGDGEGGGVAVYGSSKSMGGKDAVAFSNAFFVDCVVSNCWGLWSGGVRGGTWIRSLLIDCGGTSFGQTAGEAALWNCVIANSISKNNGRPTVGNKSRLVNCTFYQCGSYGTASCSTAFNCVYACRTGSADMSTVVVSQYYPAAVFYNCYGKEDDPQMLFAPALGDFRILAGSKADQGGLTEYLSEIILPADTEMKDYYGNPIDTTSSTCQAGACQETVTAASGRIQIYTGYTFNGWKALTTTYAYSETFPNTLVVHPIEAKHFRFRLEKFKGSSAFRYMQPDGTMHLAYPPMPTDVTAFSEDTVGLEIWTDPDADAETADGTEDHPFRTLQAAMDYLTENGVTANTIVHAKPGNYCEGGAEYANASNRVVMPDIPIILRSTQGAAVTKIFGQSDPNAPKDYFPGCGPAAMRCLTFANPSYTGASRAIQGFTFTGGRSSYLDYSSVDNCEYGGGVLSDTMNASMQVLDSVFTNCHAVRCGAVMGTWNTRCSFYDCHGFGGVMRCTILAGCYVDSSCSIGQGPTGGSANCVLGSDTESYLTTCIGASYTDGEIHKWHLSDLGLNTLASGYHLWGTVAPVGTYSATPPNHGGTTSELEVVDGANGDWRLVTGAAAVTAGRRPEAGTAEYGAWATNFASYVSSGLDSAKLSLSEGHILPGCYQKTVDGINITAAQGGLEISGGKVGFNELSDTLNLTISVGTGTRPCVGFAANGTTNLFAQTSSVTLTAADVTAANGRIDVEPIYGTDWYVNPDPLVGNDANNGFSATSPKRTLKAIMEAGVVSGDTVHAAKGIYDSLTMGTAGDLGCGETLSRVIIPAGVTLVAEEGADETFIVGTNSGAPNVDKYGRGTNAVRCVYLRVGACVRGFTLTGGRTWGDTWNNSSKREYQGAGIYSPANNRDDILSTRVENCIVSNCVALLGGAGYQVNFVNCRLFNCRAQRGSATERCGLVNVIVDNMDSEGGTGICVNDWYQMVNCTIGSNIRRDSGSGTSFGAAIYRQWSSDYGITNTVCLGAVYNVTNAFNSAFITDRGLSWAGCLTVTAADCALDDDYRPNCRTSVLVDKGIATDVPSTTDVYGGQRVYNGRIDIGAVEGDWRSLYARDIADSLKMTVDAATSGIIENATTHKVTLADGERMTAHWLGKAGRKVPYVLTVRLTGTGTLSVSLNGALLREISDEGETTLRFSGEGNQTDFELSYGGAGTAEILESRSAFGTVLIVR